MGEGGSGVGESLRIIGIHREGFRGCEEKHFEMWGRFGG